MTGLMDHCTYTHLQLVWRRVNPQLSVTLTSQCWSSTRYLTTSRCPRLSDREKLTKYSAYIFGAGHCMRCEGECWLGWLLRLAKRTQASVWRAQHISNSREPKTKMCTLNNLRTTHNYYAPDTHRIVMKLLKRCRPVNDLILIWYTYIAHTFGI